MTSLERDTELNNLKQLLAQERTAHFSRDAKLFTSQFSKDFINISSGKISRPTQEESTSRFQAYFDRSTFLEWDDIEPPIIRLAQDASMAYVIARKRVRLKIEDDKEEHQTIFAWLEVWEKEDEAWKLKAIASTNE